MTEYQHGRSFFRLGICGAVMIFLIAGSLFTLESTGATQEGSPLTVILVRHAEKKVVPPENKDPDLSAAGEARAKEIAMMFGASGSRRYMQLSSNGRSKPSSHWRSKYEWR
jgi:hypothetical protein